MTKMRHRDFLKVTQLFNGPDNHEFLTWAGLWAQSFAISSLVSYFGEVDWRRGMQEACCLSYMSERKERIEGN